MRTQASRNESRTNSSRPFFRRSVRPPFFSLPAADQALRSKADGGRSMAGDLATRLARRKGGGEPLPAGARKEMESAFGVSLARVRTHRDPEAVRMTRELNAHAFTHDSDVYFNQGRFAPDSATGRHLLAHELTHVVQQDAVGPREAAGDTVRGGPAIQRSEAGDEEPESVTVEREARSLVETSIRSWEVGRDHLGDQELSEALLTSLLESWLGTLNRSQRILDQHLGGDEQLLARLKEAYRASVSAAVAEASRDLGTPEQELYARHNAHLAWWLRGQVAPREDVVFVLGEDSFHIAATSFFELSGSRIIADLRSLREVRDWLAANPPAGGLPWGEVNIVSHADLEGGMTTAVVPGGDRTTPTALRQAIERQEFLPLPDEIVDDATQLIVRGCALGRNQEILELLRSAFGGNEESPQIYAPVHLQAYSATGKEEYFQEFWYVGFPAEPQPAPAQLATMFQEKYPDVDVDWATMTRAPGASDSYEVEYSIADADWLPAGGPEGREELAQLVRRRNPEAAAWTELEETSRETAGNGLTGIQVSYKEGATVGTVELRNLLPPMSSEAEYRSLLRRQADLLSTTRRLEEASGLGADDFSWRLVREPGEGGAFDYTFTGRRGLVRIQRDLVEPVPGQKGRTRRVLPDISDPSQFGRELPEAGTRTESKR